MSGKSEETKQLDRDRGNARYRNDPIYRLKTQLRSNKKHYLAQLALERKEMNRKPWTCKVDKRGDYLQEKLEAREDRGQ